MPKKSNSNKPIIAGLGVLIGLGVVGLFLWAFAVVALAALLYFTLSLLTNWGIVPKLGVSVVSSYIILRALGFLLDVLDLLPQWWLDPRKKPAPCPHCGEPLRTALAQQCRHCGADWHAKSRST